MASAVAGIVPRLGRRTALPERRQAAGPAGRPLLRQRLSLQGMVGQGQGRDMELGQVLAAARPISAKRCSSSAGCTTRRPEGQHPQLADGQPAFRRAARLRRRNPLRHQLRSAARPASRPATKVPSLVLACEQSNPSVHKNYSMLYSSHISWSSPTTPTPLELYPGAGLRSAFQGRNAAGATGACSMPSWPMPRTCAAISAPATSTSSMSISIPCATSNSASTGRQARRIARLAAHPRTARTSRARPTASRKTSPSTCG